MLSTIRFQIRTLTSCGIILCTLAANLASANDTVPLTPTLHSIINGCTTTENGYEEEGDSEFGCKQFTYYYSYSTICPDPGTPDSSLGLFCPEAMSAMARAVFDMLHLQAVGCKDACASAGTAGFACSAHATSETSNSCISVFEPQSKQNTFHYTHSLTTTCNCRPIIPDVTEPEVLPPDASNEF